MAHENWKKSEFHLEIDMNENENERGCGGESWDHSSDSFVSIDRNKYIWNFGFELDNATLNLCRGNVIDIADLPVLFSISLPLLRQSMSRMIWSRNLRVDDSRNLHRTRQWRIDIVTITATVSHFHKFRQMIFSYLYLVNGPIGDVLSLKHDDLKIEKCAQLGRNRIKKSCFVSQRTNRCAIIIIWMSTDLQ